MKNHREIQLKLIPFFFILLLPTFVIGQTPFLFFLDERLVTHSFIRKVEITQNGKVIDASYKFPNLYGDFSEVTGRVRLTLFRISTKTMQVEEYNLDVSSALLSSGYVVFRIYTKENYRKTFPFDDKDYVYEYDSDIFSGALARRKFSFKRWIKSLFKTKEQFD